MKRTLITALFSILFAFMALPASAQVEDDLRIPDSLLVLLEENPEPDIKRAEALITILQYLSIERHYLESKPYVEELSDLADKLKDPYIKAVSELSMSILTIETKDDIKQAFKYINNSFIIASQLPENKKHTTLMARIYNNMGTCYSQLGMEADAYECYIKGLEINDKVHDKRIDYILKMNMLNSFYEMKKYDESIALAKKIIADKEYVYDLYVPYSCIASAYKAKEVYDTALMYYDTTYYYAKSERDESRCVINWIDQSFDG